MPNIKRLIIAVILAAFIVVTVMLASSASAEACPKPRKDWCTNIKGDQSLRAISRDGKYKLNKATKRKYDCVKRDRYHWQPAWEDNFHWEPAF